MSKKQNIKSFFMKDQYFRSGRLGKLLNSNGKNGIAISVLVAMAFVLLVNTILFQYLETEPPNITAFNPFNKFRGIQKWNAGVNTLLIGDSTCFFNLDEGAFSDRLGGQVANLGTTVQTSFLMDAWELSLYVKKFGAPKNVIISRDAPDGYNTMHSIEYMATPPLPWNYWNDLGVAPDLTKKELIRLAVAKYGVLYSYSDIFRARLLEGWNLFRYADAPVYPSNEYTRGDPREPDSMELNTLGYYLNDLFIPSSDTTIALKYMSNLAREKHFQLYIVFQPELDEALNTGIRQYVLIPQVQYLSQFTDPTYVHIVRDETLAFPKARMKNANHLRPGADHILTEVDISRIVSIQNALSAKQAQPLRLDFLRLDKDNYQMGDIPVINLTISDLGALGITGGVSCLIKPSGEADGYWVSRAPASYFKMEDTGMVNLTLKSNIGNLNKANVYDLVVFLRQDVGYLSNEIRVEFPNKIIVE
jgi:hypothetical protein